jgi:lipid A ethanolaminephosphotransferase
MLRKLLNYSPQLSITMLILLTAGFFTLFLNTAFFRNSWAVYAGQEGGLWFLGSLALFLFAVTFLMLSALCVRFLTKPVLILVVSGAACTSYFMNRYNIVVDTTMLTNVMETDTREVADLLDVRLLLQYLLLGLLPSLFIWRTRIVCRHIGRELLQRLKLAGGALALMLACITPFTAFYTDFFREHKILRYYTNPETFIYSTGKFVKMALEQAQPHTVEPIGMDAHLPETDFDRELIVLVVGEAARADRFGLNGYERQTTPLLAQRDDIISLRNVSSCGTATAWSVPCMFSLKTRDDFELDEADEQENLLDVLSHADVNVLWRDNNSDSKGVATNVRFEDFRTPERNPVCDEECRDVGMLSGLDEYIAAHPRGDIVIVLHQMGNHGPAYYKRFPPEFARYTPYCQSSRLDECSDEEIGNAYDNAIVYTDWFLDQVIRFLQTHDAAFETAMLYMADHGESLGENGLYLHGLPYLLAPEQQKHVASVLWFGRNYAVDRRAVARAAQMPLSHDNYFHSVLGLMEIQTDVYQQDLDIIVHTQQYAASSKPATRTDGAAATRPL